MVLRESDLIGKTEGQPETNWVTLLHSFLE